MTLGHRIGTSEGRLEEITFRPPEGEGRLGRKEGRKEDRTDHNSTNAFFRFDQFCPRPSFRRGRRGSLLAPPSASLLAKREQVAQMEAQVPAPAGQCGVSRPRVRESVDLRSKCVLFKACTYLRVVVEIDTQIFEDTLGGCKNPLV